MRFVHAPQCARLFKQSVLVLGSCFILSGTAQAAILITEVHPTGSSATYGADWFELKNTGASAVDITGWKVDDGSNDIATAVALRGSVTSIPAGASAVFYEGNASGSNDATIKTNFINAWFGGNPPAGFLIGAYGGSGIGLSSGTDELHIFDAGGNPVVGVAFGNSTTGVTFDNTAGIGDATPFPPSISTLSAVNVNGAFTSATGNETGSPGNLGPGVPEPTTAILSALLVGALALARRR
jgi:hypothetical protein